MSMGIEQQTPTETERKGMLNYLNAERLKWLGASVFDREAHLTQIDAVLDAGLDTGVFTVDYGTYGITYEH